MGDVIQLNGDLKEAWDLQAVVIRGNQGTDELARALEEGFEPFTVIHWMEVPQAKVVVGNQNAPIIVKEVWFRRKQLVKVVSTPQNA